MKTRNLFALICISSALLPSCHTEKTKCTGTNSPKDEKESPPYYAKAVVTSFASTDGENIQDGTDSVGKKDAYVFEASEDNTLVCAKGTKIEIKANTLVVAKTGEPFAGKAKLEVREYYDMKDFLAAGLTTSCRDTLIESGGTIYLQARDAETGDRLNIKEGESVAINFPTANFKPGMMLFNGDSIGNTIDWNLASDYRDTFYVNNALLNKADSPASFPGGTEGMEKFIQENCMYPLGGHKNAAEGPVFVNFIVHRNGKISDIEVLKKRNPHLDSMALKVVEKFPRFSPAVRQNKYCSFKMTVPIRFYLWYNKYHPQYYNKELCNSFLFGKMDPDYRPQELDSLRRRGEYVLKTRQFGWINCDRFMGVPLKQFTIDTDATRVLVVMKNRMALMYARRMDLYRHIINLPEDENISMVAIKQDYGGELMFAKKSVNTEKGVVSGFEYKKISKKELQNIISTLR